MEKRVRRRDEMTLRQREREIHGKTEKRRPRSKRRRTR